MADLDAKMPEPRKGDPDEEADLPAGVETEGDEEPSADDLGEAGVEEG